MEYTHLQPLVSAIVSTYNSERFIRGCIEDLEQQTIADRLEIIIIDSASPQNEGEIVRELQGRYNNIRYLRTERRETVYAAWNRGIAMARGRYFTNANTDDRHRSDAFELMARVMEDCPAVDLVYADVLITKTPNGTFEHHTPGGKYSWYDWDRNILLDKGCFIGPQPMWRRSLHELYGGFDPACVTSGDYEFWLRISQTSNFFHIRQPLGLYLAHPDSIEHQNEETKYSENSTIREIYYQAAREGHLVGLLPLQQMRTCAVSGSPDVAFVDVMTPLIDMVETLLIPGTYPSGHEREQYLLDKARLLGGAEPEQPSVDAFLHRVEQLILGGREWYVNRRSVENTTTDEPLQRLQLLAEAVLKARLFVQRGDVDNAVSTLLEQGIKAAPLSPAAYYELADILMAADRHADALQVLPELPPSADVCRQQEIQAICFAALGQDDAARHAALRATDYPRATVTLGTLAARSGHLAEAECMFRLAIEADRSCGAAWLSLGMLQWGSGDQEGAYKAVRRAVVVDPLNDAAVTILRDMAGRIRHNEDALQVISMAAQMYPDSRNLACQHAELLAESGRDRDALVACEAILVRFDVDEKLLNLALQLRRQVGGYRRPTEAGTRSISLCMIVKNEENNLPACLSSLRPVVDEMVIVDTGSSDRTMDIATVFGARVLHFPWNGNFSDARNVALAAAQKDWILVMDADEVFSSQDYDQLRQTVQKGTAQSVCWNVMTRNYTRIHPQGWIANDGSYPCEERAEGWHPSRKVRLFPNDARVRFQGAVHEMVDMAVEQAGYKITEAPFVVHHYGALEERSWGPTPKQLAYFELGLQKLTEHPEDVAAIGELAVQAAEIGRYDAAVSLWDRFLALRPDAVIALFNKGFVLMSLHRYAEALIVSKRALELDPNHREAAFNYGMCELYAGDPELALKRVRPVAGRNPEHPLLQALFAVLCFVCNTGTEGREKMSMLKESGFKIEAYIAERALALDACGRENMAAGLRQESGINL